MPLDEHRRVNLANWEDRVPIHLASRDYGVAAFVGDPAAHPSGVVVFDAGRVGDVRGKRLLHLQCHFGRDTLSWATLGAEVTGVDFSPTAITAARRLAADSGVPGRFVQAELCDTPDVLDERFDIVYTGVGALNWLPDIAGWARVVARLLAPGGLLYLREGHPVLWCLDETRADEALLLTHPYFETVEPLVWDDPHTYTDEHREVLEHTVTQEWNHGLGETVTALLEAGLTLTSLVEHREVEWRALPWMVQGPDGRWRLPDGSDRLPLMYSLTAVARA